MNPLREIFLAHLGLTGERDPSTTGSSHHRTDGQRVRLLLRHSQPRVFQGSVTDLETLIKTNTWNLPLQGH